MGFPDWTLWGMGLSALGTLLFLVMALIAQSPGFMKRAGLSGSRLDLRVRSLTGFALAMLLLAIGFFLAGVPLDSTPQTTAAGPTVPAATESVPVNTPEMAGSAPAPTGEAAALATPATGAFGGPPPSVTPTAEDTTAEATAEEAVEETVAIESTSLPGPSPTPTATASQPNTPTVTPTPAPTETPLPTLTPTPIAGQTAIIATGGSTVWLYRSPGGQTLVTIGSGERVIVLSGHANQGGILWREVSTLDGTTGWVQEEFLEYES